MSMYLEFEPHSWYFEFAIKKDPDFNDPCEFTYEAYSKRCIVHGQNLNPFNDFCEGYSSKWTAFTDDGNSYSIIVLHAETLKELKEKIVQHWLRDNGKHIPAFYEKALLKHKE